jgi:hypothetical protein
MVAEVPAIPGSYTLMNTREPELAESSNAFWMIAGAYSEKGSPPTALRS